MTSKALKFEITDIGIHSTLEKFNKGPSASDFILGFGDSAKESYQDALEKVNALLAGDVSGDSSKIEKATQKANSELSVGIYIEISFKGNDFENITAEPAMVGNSNLEFEKIDGKEVLSGEVKSIDDFLKEMRSIAGEIDKRNLKIGDLDIAIISDEIRYIQKQNKNNKYIVLVNVFEEDIKEDKSFDDVTLICEQIERKLRC